MTRRAEYELRAEMLNNGGHLVCIRFADESIALDGKLFTKWQTIERKGFFVLKTGCLVPHTYYSKKGKDGPARARGHIVSNDLFVDGVNKLRGSGEKDRNDDGWPLLMEVSHICHNPLCCAPWHLVTEPRWKNWRRNYCSGCDCPDSLMPRCVARFHPTNWWHEKSNWTNLIVTDSKMALQILRAINEKEEDKYTIKLLPSNFYKKKDVQAINRNKRLQKKRKHDRQRADNEARKKAKKNN